MVQRRHIAGMSGMLLAAGVVAGTTAASAQSAPTTGKHAHVAPITGKVTNVGSGTLQIQTATGSVTVGFTSTTRVVKMVAGTAADLTNARVALRFATGSTTTVSAVTIEPAFTRPASTSTSTTTGTHTHTHAWTHKPSSTTGSTSTTPTGTAKHTFTGIHARGGQVVGVRGNTITVRGRSGQTATYTLASNATITKVTAGTTADLKFGETVLVSGPSGAAARSIIILNS